MSSSLCQPPTPKTAPSRPPNRRLHVATSLPHATLTRVKHSTYQQTRRGRGPARRIGRSLALVLPVVLVLSGTLAVTRVNWSGDPSSSSVLTASDATVSDSKPRGAPLAPQD